MGRTSQEEQACKDFKVKPQAGKGKGKKAAQNPQPKKKEKVTKCHTPDRRQKRRDVRHHVDYSH